jgi:ABC-type glycerol-3-phosphate transport system permease component
MNKVLKVLSALLLCIGVILVLFPFLWSLLLSFKDNSEIMQIPGTFLPSKWIISGYVTVLTESPFFIWFLNSVVVSISVTLIVAFTSALGGYIFAKFNFRGKNIIFLLMLSTMMVPFQVTMIPTYLISSYLGILNSQLALIIPSMVTAFGIFLCKQFVENVPNELLEAGRIEGAGELRIFYSIVMPSIKSALAALSIFTFMGKWNDYLWPLIAINDEIKMTVPLALNFFNSSKIMDYNVSMSAGILVMLPVIIIYLVFQRQFIEGLTLTGMK